jgi:alpha-2-macroglobulin
VLANPNLGNACGQSLCRAQLRLAALVGLDALGERRADFLGDLVAERQQLDLAAQVRLARYLNLFPQWQAEAKTQAAQLQQVLYQTGRSATVNVPVNYPQGYTWLGEPASLQAQMLQLLLSQAAPTDQIDRGLQALLDLRRQGTWSTPFANAQAIGALVDYSKLEPDAPNFTAVVTLAGKDLSRQQFQGYTTIEGNIEVAGADLPPGKQELRVSKSGTGRLHYLANLRYPLPANAPGRMNGLRVSRKIRVANQTEMLQSLDLKALAKPITVQAGQVLDIGLEVITDHPINHLLMTDPLPAGLEAVDTTFQTTTAYFQPLQDSWDIDYQRIYPDRVVAYADRLDAGVYNLHYLVRAITPGQFIWPGAEAHLQYAPEEFGRSTAAMLELKGG